MDCVLNQNEMITKRQIKSFNKQIRKCYDNLLNESILFCWAMHQTALLRAFQRQQNSQADHLILSRGFAIKIYYSQSNQFLSILIINYQFYDSLRPHRPSSSSSWCRCWLWMRRLFIQFYSICFIISCWNHFVWFLSIIWINVRQFLNNMLSNIIWIISDFWCFVYTSLTSKRSHTTLFVCSRLFSVCTKMIHHIWSNLTSNYVHLCKLIYDKCLNEHFFSRFVHWFC